MGGRLQAGKEKAGSGPAQAQGQEAGQIARGGDRRDRRVEDLTVEGCDAQHDGGYGCTPGEGEAQPLPAAAQDPAFLALMVTTTSPRWSSSKTTV